jgi:hypothetical protein
MKNKYGIVKACLFCDKEFITKPRHIDYCSQSCKNPNNRHGNTPWNKGIKLTEEQKAKQNTDGLKKGWGWNKGKPNEIARRRMLTDNPNKDGKVNNARPKKPCNDKFKQYRGLVRRATYRTIKEMKANGEWVPEVGKYKDSWQIDHIIPHKQGYELGIDPGVLGSRKNLQFIKGKENRKKWDSYQSVEIIESIIGVKNVV